MTNTASEALARLRALHKRVDAMDLAQLDEEAAILNALPVLLDAAEALAECADDLEVEVGARWTDPDGTVHPALQRKLDRDMEPVRKARAALDAIAKLEGK